MVYTPVLGRWHRITLVDLWCYQMIVKQIIHSGLLSLLTAQLALADTRLDLLYRSSDNVSVADSHKVHHATVFLEYWQLERQGWDITLFDHHPREDQAWLWYQTKVTFGLALGALGVIALLPEHISKWDKSNIRPFRKWWQNVKSGPVWDTDKWYINYIGHPYFGGVYYVAARSSGYNPWNSFIYSFLMSTFVYEYGVEAMCEVPSIQDVIVTPVGGWLYGELAYRGKKNILANDSKVLGSPLLGAAALWLLDPVGEFSQWLSGDHGPVQNLSMRLSFSPAPGSLVHRPRYLGMELLFNF